MTDRCRCWDDPNPPPGARCKLCDRVAPGEPAHHCHARGCAVRTKPELLMCPRHWRQVPRSIQQAVYAAYRRGQCDDMSPSTAWHEAADAAIGFVAALERRPMRPPEIKSLGNLGYTTTTDLAGELVVRQTS